MNQQNPDNNQPNIPPEQPVMDRPDQDQPRLDRIPNLNALPPQPDRPETVAAEEQASFDRTKTDQPRSDRLQIQNPVLPPQAEQPGANRLPQLSAREQKKQSSSVLYQKQNPVAQSKLLRKYCIISGVMACLVMLFFYLCHSNSLLGGDATVLRMDLYHQYGPLYAELYDRIVNGYSLVYSWTSGLGGAFLGNLFNYCASPFAIIILLLGHKNMPEAIAIMILLKAVLSSVSFTYYISKSTKHISVINPAFGLLYAFSSYFVAYSWNIMWLDAMAVFPFVILGIERIIDKKRPMTYILALTYTMITNYYMAFMVCIISVLYFLFYYFSNYPLLALLGPAKITVPDPQFAKGLVIKQPPSEITLNGQPPVAEAGAGGADLLLKNNAYGNEYAEQILAAQPAMLVKQKSPLLNSRFLAAGFIFAFSSILCFMLSAFSLLPVYFCLQNSSATGSTFPKDFKLYFNLFDFVANHLPSVNPTIRSSGTDVLPNVYCGLVTILLLPAFFLSDHVKGRHKVCATFLLLVFYLSFNINQLNFIWHGWHYPNDLPYRFSFAYSFVLLTLAYHALLHIREFSRKYFVFTGFGAFAFVMLINKLGSKNVEYYTLILTFVFAVIYVILAGLLTSKSFPKKNLEYLLIFFIIVELCCADTPDFIMSQSKTNYTSDYPTYLSVSAEAQEGETELFYRTELSKLRARMDPSWYGYNGVSVFSSMAYENTSAMMKGLGLFGNNINSYTYYPQTPVFNSFFSLKYVYDNYKLLSENENDNIYTKVASSGNYDAYRYNYFLPIAFSVDAGVKEWSATANSDPFETQNELIEKATGVKDVFIPEKVTDYFYANLNYISKDVINSGTVFYVEKQKGAAGGGNVQLYIDVSQDGHYYVYAGSTHLSSIKFAGGEEMSYQYISSSVQPFVLDMGYRKQGERIKVEYELDTAYDSASLSFCAARLDLDAFEEAYKKITEENGVIQLDSFEETSLSGKITVKNKNAFLFTSIPYDQCWQITVDGVMLEYAKEDDTDTSGKIVAVSNGLIGFELSPGEHTVSFVYKAKGLVDGAKLTAVGLLIGALLLLFKFLIKGKLIRAGRRSEIFECVEPQKR